MCSVYHHFLSLYIDNSILASQGDILFLHMSKDPIRTGEIVVFNIDVGSPLLLISQVYNSFARNISTVCYIVIIVEDLLIRFCLALVDFSLIFLPVLFFLLIPFCVIYMPFVQGREIPIVHRVIKVSHLNTLFCIELYARLTLPVTVSPDN